MKSVKLLQILAQHYNHLQEQPQKALVDILSEVWVNGVWDLGSQALLVIETWRRHELMLTGGDALEQHCSVEIQKCVTDSNYITKVKKKHNTS